MKIHKAWIMAIAVAFVMVVGFGLLSGIVSVYMKPICDDLGFSRGTYSLTRTVLSLVSILFVPLIRKLISTMGAKKVMLIACIAMSLTNLLYAISTKMWKFFAIAVIQGVFTNGLSLFVAANFINYWFKDSIGIATAIAYSGTGLGSSIFSPIVNSIIEVTSWQFAFVVTSAATLVLVVPVLLFVLKDTPESVGLEKYTKKDKNEGKQVLTAKPAEENFTMFEIRRMPSFYLLIIAFLLMSLFNNGPWAHTVAFLSDIGYSASEATALNSFYLLMLTVAKLIMGLMFDKLGKKITSIILSVALVCAPAFAILISMPVSPWLYCICLGFTGATYTVGMNLLLGATFGQRAFGDVLSVFTMITSFSGALASPLMGTIFDITGSYLLSYEMFLVMAVISVICILLTVFGRRGRIEVREA